MDNENDENDDRENDNLNDTQGRAAMDDSIENERRDNLAPVGSQF
jgi:hypothetical protein